MSTESPEDAVARVRRDIDILSARLVRLSENLQSLSASLDTVVAPSARPAAGVAAEPTAEPRVEPATESVSVPPMAPMPPVAPVQTAPVPSQTRPAQAPTWRPSAAPPKPRKTWTLAEVFSIVGSAITLIGVALVLMLPQDGFMGPLPRTAIGLGLAAAAVVAALWQHRADPKNIGAQALLATGIASTFLCIVALTAIFHHPDGRPLLAVVPGLAVAGLVSLAGVWMAGRWASQWLAMLAVLGSLLLAPFLGEDNLLSVAFMAVMMLATGFFQRGLGWTGLVLARTLPTGLVALAVMATPALTSDGMPPNLVPYLVLASAIAVGGLVIAVMHQEGAASERAAAVASMALLAAPVLLVGWQEGEPLGVTVFLLLGALFTAVGFLREWIAELVCEVALPLGAVYLASAGLIALDASWRGMVFLVLAISYLVVASRTMFRIVLIVGSLLAGLGVAMWLPTLGALFNWRLATGAGRLGLTDVFTSLLVLATAIVAAIAYRAFLPARRVGIHWATWAAALVSGTVAVVLGGTLLGRAAGQPLVGFQVAHAVVTVTWMGLCVFLLSRGLRRDERATGSLWLAIALAGAAVAKLFLFDLGTLPGLARALAFLAVGVLLLIVGTWYNRQLEKVRRARPVPDAPPAVGAPVAGDAEQPLRILFVGPDSGRAAALLRARVEEDVDVRSVEVADPALLFHADRVIVVGDTPVEPVIGMRGTIERWGSEDDLAERVGHLVEGGDLGEG